MSPRQAQSWMASATLVALFALLPAIASASVPRPGAAAIPLAVEALATPPLERSLAGEAGSPFALDGVSLAPRRREAGFRVFAGDELGAAHLLIDDLIDEPRYPETRVGGFGLPGEARVGAERSLRLEAPWACDERSSGRATGSGEFRIFDPSNSPRSASTFGWNRLFQGREHLGFVDAYDFRARVLWPELGRFGQEDPAGTVDSLNRYQALRGAWSLLRDPLGKRIAGVFVGFREDELSANVTKALRKVADQVPSLSLFDWAEKWDPDTVRPFLSSREGEVFLLGHRFHPTGTSISEFLMPDWEQPEGVKNYPKNALFVYTGKPTSRFLVALACGSSTLTPLQGLAIPTVTVAESSADSTTMAKGLIKILEEFYTRGASLGEATRSANREIETFGQKEGEKMRLEMAASGCGKPGTLPDATCAESQARLPTLKFSLTAKGNVGDIYANRPSRHAPRRR